MVVVTVANQKGGTGKTTTVVTLGHRLALDGHRVLIVDTDVQGHVAVALGLDKQPGIYRLVQWYQGVASDLLIVPARERLDVLPSDKSTEPAKRILAGMDFRERILVNALDALKGKYDVILIDTAPSVDVLHVAALVASHYLLVVTKLDHLAIDGVREIITTLAAIRRQSGQGPELLGIIPTFLDRQTNESALQLRALANGFGRLVWPPIPVDVKLRECPAFGRTIWEYAPSSRGVIGVPNGTGKLVGGYAQVVARIVQVLK